MILPGTTAQPRCGSPERHILRPKPGWCRNKWFDTYGFHGALDPVEGAVWRVERNELIRPGGQECRWHVDFLVKYVRPDKIDGSYLSEISGLPPVYNWMP